jgi:predicted MFS family arabinose efflux permease
MDRFSVILSGVVISALGALVYNLLPLFLGTAQDFRELSDQAVGILSSGFYVGFTLTTVTAFFWIRKLSWRKVTWFAVPVAALALVLAGYAGSYALLLAGIFISGGAFSALYGIGTTVLSDTSNPARWYGLKIASEAGVGAIMLLILPGLVIARWGFEGMMVAMAAVLFLLAPLLAWLPSTGTKGGGEQGQHVTVKLEPELRTALWMGLAGVMVFLFCTTMIWAFVERMANEAGFDPVATGNVLSLTLVFAVGGSLLAMLMGERFGAGKPFTVACLVLLFSLYLLAQVGSLWDYGLASCTFTFAFGLGIPYVVTIVADLDVDGRFVVLTVPAIGIGVMIAPAVGGVLTSDGGYQTILWVGAAAAVVALILSLFALRMGLALAEKMREEMGLELPDPIL